MRKILLLVLISALFVSCKTTSHYVKYNESMSYYLSPQGKSFTTPLMTDITVDNERITYQQVFVNNLSEEDVKSPISSEAIQYMKKYTLTQAAFANNADIIVCPLIDIKTSDDFTLITVKLTGYPGSFSNFRKANKEDFDLIRMSENELNLQELAKQGILLPPCMQNGVCSDEECPMVEHKHKRVKEVTPVNLKEAKFTIEK